MREPKLPRGVLRKLDAFRSARIPVVVHWFDANYDSTGTIRNGEIRANIGCPDATIGYYHGVKDGCVVLSWSAYTSCDGYENHRHVWTIPVGMVIRVDRLSYSKTEKRER